MNRKEKYRLSLYLYVFVNLFDIFVFKYLVDDNFHMNSLLFHRMVQPVLSFVQWNVHDEASLEFDSILLNNLDLDL